jgi:hypothetical protein
MELYEWTKTRFANQVRALEPQIFRDRYLFDIVNSSCHRLRRMRRKNIRKAVTNLVRHSFSKEKVVYLLAAREIYETFSDF